MNDRKMKPGEKGFSIFLLLLIIYLLVSSIQMFLDTPKLSSYGGYPLILSILLLILVVKVIFENRGAGKKEQSKDPGPGDDGAGTSGEVLETVTETAAATQTIEIAATAESSGITGTARAAATAKGAEPSANAETTATAETAATAKTAEAAGAAESAESAPKKSLKETIAAGLHYLLPKDVLILILMLIVYSICLFLGFGFYPCTAVFLVAAMQYLKPDGLKWNLVTAVVLLVLIYVAFTVIFKVRLP